MASPAREARLKVLANKPNAQVVERGRGFLRMYDPDTDKFIFQTQTGNIGWHYGQDWQNEVDTDWVYVGPGWEMVKAEYNATLQGNTYVYTDPNTDSSVSLTLSSVPQWTNGAQRETAAGLNAVTPEAVGDVITFPDLLGAGADLRVEAQTARLAKRLIVPSLSTFTTPSLSGTVYLSFNLTIQTAADIYIDGNLWDKNTETQTSAPVEFRSGGVPVFYFDIPYALDANGEQINGIMNFKKAGNNLFVEVWIPYTWMQAATFPIEIDPSVNPQVAASADDAREDQNGSISTTVTSYQVDSPSKFAAARWAVAVAKDATVSSAYASFYSSTTVRPIVCDVNVENADSAAVYVDGTNTYTISGRTYHTGVAWTDSVTSAAFYDTSDISDEVQSTLARAGWSSGNYIGIAVNETSGGTSGVIFEFYDLSSSNAPKLYVEYSTSGESSSVSPSLSPSSSVSPSPSSSASSSASPSESPSQSPSSSESPSLSSSSSVSPSLSPSSSVSPSVSPSPSPPQTSWWNPSSYNIVKGTLDSGTLADVYLESDAGMLIINEAVGVYVDPATGGGFTIDFEFGEYDDVPGTNEDLYIEGWYEGNPAHNVKLQEWNYTSSEWVDVTAATNDFPSDTSEQSYKFFLNDSASYTENGNIRVRIIHTSAGVSGHQFHIERLYLQAGGQSFSVSPSVSPSLSPSSSESPSASSSNSPSLSPSSSESISASASASASESPSSSVSPSVSPSPSPAVAASVVWGHVTSVTEDNARTFAQDWTGTGTIELSGDDERIALSAGQSMTSAVVSTGAVSVVLTYNQYKAGDTVTFEYRHGATPNACDVASWNTYTVPFVSDGYVQVRVSA